MEVDKQGSLICQADIPNNTKVRLMMGTKDSALNASIQALWEAKDAVRKNKLVFALIFDSLSRLKLLGRNAQKESGYIKEQLKDIPFLGVYTYAEIAPLRALDYAGESYLHNESINVITFAQ